MKYIEEYQEYMKNIVDKFINKLTYNTEEPLNEIFIPKYKKVNGKIIFDVKINENGDIFYVIDESPKEMDGVIKHPKDVVYEWIRFKNECAVKWLNKNAITYDEWFSNNKIIAEPDE